MTVKRSRDNYHQEIDHVKSTIAMANYLLMLSQGVKTTVSPYEERRVFECKTCNRQFSSFQALGGHMASHKRARTTKDDDHLSVKAEVNIEKRKNYECSICGMTFSTGQALGGHMRRHRVTSSVHHPTVSSSLSSSSVFDYSVGLNRESILSLDLNLTPQENGLLEMR